MTELKNILSAFVARRGILLAVAAVITSCSTIYTDMSDCPTGLSLNFRYEYNMSDVNTFHKKNDCLTVLVYDSDGNLVTSRSESGEVLADEDYQMDFEIPAGSYNIVAYGGMFCERSSFIFKDVPVKSVPDKMSDLYVALDHDTHTSSKHLHNHFHGKTEVAMERDYVRDTVYMVKNTNNIRIILQQAQGASLSSSDFTFSITDDNTLMDSSNKVIPDSPITYYPWTTGEEVIGTSGDEDTPISVAYAEFSTGRIMAGSDSRLTVARKDTGESVLSIPLDTYLLLLKSEVYAEMQAQEYLDREDEWSIVFFLDSGLRWINTHIIVNDWTVRLNDIGLQ